MDKKYMCYCGLYCENCATKAKVESAAEVLYREMKTAGFEDVIQFLPDGGTFWSFLKSMAEEGTCASCRNGSGNPGCVIRICAKEKGVEMCAFCERYPCEHFPEFFGGYPVLKADNILLREKGTETWLKLQEQRKSEGYTYSDNKER